MVLLNVDPMEIAFHYARVAATCRRRRIGCAITDTSGGILGVGYNGTSPACEPCSCDAQCGGSHAEMRALISCGNSLKAAHTLYSTKAPCENCIRTLLLTPLEEIVFAIASDETRNRELWEKAGRRWTHEPCSPEVEQEFARHVTKPHPTP